MKSQISMIKNMVLSAVLVLTQATVAFGQNGSATGSQAGSATSLAGIRASSLGSVVAVNGSAQASAGLANAASMAIHASVKAGQKIVIASVEVVGKFVKVTYQASIKGSELALKLGRDIIVFSALFARDAFEASLRAAGMALETLVKTVVNGVEVVVRATAIVAGSAGIVVGHVLSLAAVPAQTLGVILNDIGRDLYNN